MYERAKARKMADVLVNYFFRNDILSLNVEIDVAPEQTRISVKGTTDRKIPNVDDVCANMQQTRRVEFEDYYDELLGTRDTDDDLELMAFLVDEAQVTFEKNELIFTIIRHRATTH